ncbi:carbon-nitrogen hydrolase family protein [Leucobacter chromiiresistens]|uniref:Predicted amidohydrolase n=1 Tax=Leucobacter chromiiresistens TaxID=1079994 RepID=A0A1H0XYV8_9MICO|nr:carbon-nitrogen hydrolase family protein [Leucobacter chromiiresistens]SDQ08025.1 Predicted amidohydrolase [Leucobacter chromiiresistens]
MSEFRLTVAQFSATLDVARNRELSVSLIAQAAPSSDLVVIPENAMYSDPAKEQPDSGYSEALDGDFVTALREAAERGGTHVVAGFTETNPGGHPYNTLVHIAPTGELDGIYRKIHLYDAFGYRESDSVTAASADTPLTFAVNGITVGAATCYDLRFPEMARWLVDHGADVLVYPAAWAVGPMKELHWESLLRARAIENTTYVAAAGQTGPHCTGQSQIIDPLGIMRASAGEEADAFATAVISSDRVAQVRSTNPCLENRRFVVGPQA